jgi:hypothetical protein
MADDPNETELQTFKVLVTVTEYRTYTIYADGQEEARQTVLGGAWMVSDYDTGDDVPDSIEIIELWEA